MSSVLFQGKPFNITLIQIYAPTINAEEAKVEWFYEDLQDLLELTPPKKYPFHYRGLECKCRKLRNTCLFTLLIFSFVVQKLLILIRSHLLIFFFYFQYSGRWVIEDPTVIYVRECFACVLLRNFIVSGLTFRSLIHFEFIFVYSVESVLFSFFYKWLTSFPSTTC